MKGHGNTCARKVLVGLARVTGRTAVQGYGHLA